MLLCALLSMPLVLVNSTNIIFLSFLGNQNRREPY